MLTWRLAWRDLRGISGGFRLLATALVLAVAAIAAVGSITDGLRQAARASTVQAIGGDLSFRLFHRAPTTEERNFLAAFGELGEVVELRVRAARPDGAGAALVELKAIDAAYPLYGSLVLDPPIEAAQALAQDGAYSWGAVVDAELLDALDLAIGDRLRVGAIEVEIRARLATEPDRALRVFALGPRVLIGQPALAATGLASPGAALYWYARLRLAPGHDPKAVVAAVETRFPHAGWRIVDAADGIPGIERSIALARTLVLSLALAILVIGGVGIAGAVTAHLAEKTATIAVLKTLGATGRQTTRIYLTQLLIVAFVATGAGLLVGAFVAVLVSVGIGSAIAGQGIVAFQPQALALAGGMALVTTLLFALYPLERAARTPPQALFRAFVAAEMPGRGWGRRRWWTALVAAGLALVLLGLVLAASELRVVVIGVLVALLAIAAIFAVWARLVILGAKKMRPAFGQAPLLRLALANLTGPGAPTHGTVIALGLGLTALIAVSTLQVLAGRHVATTLPATAPDLVVINLQPAAGADLERFASDEAGIARLRMAPFLHGRVTHLDGVPVREARVPRDLAWVIRGDRGFSWSLAPLETGDSTATAAGRPRGSSLAADVAARLGLELGSRLTLDIQGAPLEVTISDLHEVDWSRLDLDFPILLDPSAAPPPHRLVAAVWLADGSERQPLVEALGRRFPDAPVIHVAEVVGAIGGLLGGIVRTLQLATLVTLAAALLVLAGGIAAGYGYRAAQGAILLSQGATRRQLARASALELGLVGLAAVLPSVVLGSLAAWLVAARIAGDVWQLEPLIPLCAGLVAVLGLAALGYTLPPRKARLQALLR